jgi:hypothetical protein
MNDELTMRMWNAEHGQFSADLSRALGGLRDALFRRKGQSEKIDRAYADPAPERPLRAAGNTLLGGLAAVATTTALLVVLASLAGPSPAFGHTAVELAELAPWGLASAAA